MSVTRVPNAPKTNTALSAACSSGSVEMVSKLIEVLFLTADDVRATKCLGFRHACAGGHIECIRWLSDKFSFTDDFKVARFATLICLC